MHRFKIGQKVVAIRDHSKRLYIKGKTYTIETLWSCQNCFVEGVSLSEVGGTVKSRCVGCGAISIDRLTFFESSFAPLQSTSDACQYKLKVSIPELITIKEYQEQ